MTERLRGKGYAEAGQMIELTLYTKPDCHLCDGARAVIERVRADLRFELEEVDITSDPALELDYGERIPVLCVNGDPQFEYRVEERELRQTLGLLQETAA